MTGGFAAYAACRSCAPGYIVAEVIAEGAPGTCGGGPTSIVLSAGTKTANGFPHAVQVIVCPAYCGTCWGVSS
jgi:hypothetical protein